MIPHAKYVIYVGNHPSYVIIAIELMPTRTSKNERRRVSDGEIRQDDYDQSSFFKGYHWSVPLQTSK